MKQNQILCDIRLIKSQDASIKSQDASNRHHQLNMTNFVR